MSVSFSLRGFSSRAAELAASVATSALAVTSGVNSVPDSAAGIPIIIIFLSALSRLSRDLSL